jgi:hypothetical protein
MGETKSAAHRFAAIRMRFLNDPRQGSLPTVQPLNLEPAAATPAGENDASVTIRPGIPTPTERVSAICAETDLLQR